MTTTAVHMANGRTHHIADAYESVRAYLAPRRFSEDDGLREVTRADGTRATLSIAAIVGIEETAARHRLGFA